MQLSLPLPVYTPAKASITGNNNAHSSAESVSKDATAHHGHSFESLLKRDEPLDDSKDDAADPDEKKAAEMAAALLWMPMVQSAPNPTVPGLPSTALANSPDLTALGETEVADGSVCFAPQSSRTFAPGLGSLGLAGETILQGKASQSTAALTGEMAGTENLLNANAVPESALTSSELAKDVSASGQSNNPAAVSGGPAMGSAEAGEGEVGDETTLLATLAKGTAMPAELAKPLAGIAQELSQLTKPFESVGSVPAMKRAPQSSRVDGVPAASNGAVTSVAALADSETLSSATPPNDGLSVTSDIVAGTDKDSAQEKNAAGPLAMEQLAKNLIKSEGKQFLDAGIKAVASVGARVGTSVAKLGAIMSAAASTSSKTVSISDPAAPFVMSGQTASTATLTPEAPTPVSTVRETMAAVISAVEALERRADVQQKSVDLNFNVGQEKLGLRVELRDGTVHTTFRTDSTEMNSVLAQEWHKIVQPTGERGLRLAEPVYSTAVTASSESNFSSLGQGAPQEREPKAPTPFVSALKREFYDSVTAESPAKDSPAVSTSQLLNVLA